MFDWFMHKAPFWSKHIYEKKVPLQARKTFAQFVLKANKEVMQNDEFAEIWMSHLSLSSVHDTDKNDDVIAKLMGSKVAPSACAEKRVKSSMATGATSKPASTPMTPKRTRVGGTPSPSKPTGTSARTPEKQMVGNANGREAMPSPGKGDGRRGGSKSPGKGGC
jgi:hypothetical protein